MPSSNSPLYDVETYLVSQLPVLLSPGVNFFVGIYPDQPDTCVSVVEYAAAAPEFTMGSGTLTTDLPCLEEARFQIMSRDAESNYRANEATIETIYRVLLGVTNLTINGTTYQTWDPLQRPFFMMRDEKRRVYHVLNLLTIRTPL